LDHLSRQRRLCAQLDAAGIDTVLVSRVTNSRYLTGFTGSTAYLLFGREPLLVVDFRYAEQAAAQAAPLAVDACADPPGLWLRTCELVAQRGTGTIAVEGRFLPVAQAGELREAAGREVLETSGLVEALREVKEADEVELIREASSVADRVFDRILELAVPGMTENELAGEIEREQRRLGSERSAAPLIVASGPRTSLPHGVAGSRTLGPSEPLMVDLSPVIGGYRADLTRTAHFGDPAEEFSRIYNVVHDALERAKEQIKSGVVASAIDAIARSHIADAGYGAFFNHSLGHGIGLDQHEGPLLSPRNDGLLEAGMVVTVEPGIYLPGAGGVRIEDSVLVTDDGCEVLNTAQRDLILL
jgi:Xaa-Pro aminopeptidase